MLAANAAHLPDGRGEQAPKGTRHGGGGEEDGGADPELASPVPAGEVVIDARKQPGLGQTQEEPGGRQALEVVHQPHCHHDDPPQDHDQRDEDARPQALQQDVGQRFSEGVGDEEDGEGSVILAAGHFQVLLQAIEPGVSDVGSVEETDEVEEAEPWDEPEVEFPEEFLVLRAVVVSHERNVDRRLLNSQWPLSLPR